MKIGVSMQLTVATRLLEDPCTIITAYYYIGVWDDHEA